MMNKNKFNTELKDPTIKEAIVYSLPDCFACDMIKDTLLHEGFVVRTRDLKQYATENELLRLQYEKQNSAPVIEIDGKFISPKDIMAGRIYQSG